VAKVYEDAALDGLTVFKGFGVRADEHLPHMSFVLGLQERFPEYDASEVAEVLLLRGLVRPDHRGYFLTTAGDRLLYATDANLQPSKEPRMMPPSRDRERLMKRSENRYRFLRGLYDVTGGAENRFANMWELGEELGLSREETSDAVDYLKGEYLLEPKTLGGGIAITHAGVREVEATIENPDEATEHFSVQVINNYFHAPVVNQHGSGNTANLGNTSHAMISHSNVGGVAVGPAATANGESGGDGAVSKEAFAALISGAQKALVDDHDRLAALGDELSDGLWEVLRRLRHLEFATASVSQVQVQIKDTVDEQAVAAIAAKLKGTSGGQALGVIKTLLGSPVTAELAKSLLGG
jgi:hypothetical protein